MGFDHKLTLPIVFSGAATAPLRLAQAVQTAIGPQEALAMLPKKY